MLPIESKFAATVRWKDGLREEQIPCRLRLPKTVRDLPEMVLLPNKKVFMELFRIHSCQVEAQIRDGVRLTATDVHLAEGTHRNWGSEDLDESHRQAKPRSLEIMVQLPSGEYSPRILFLLTESLFLEPRHFRTLHKDGSMSVDRAEPKTFDLGDGYQLSFDLTYRMDEDENKRNIQWSELQAAVDLPKDPNKADAVELVGRVDDLLLLVSLVEGRRIACLEYDSVSSNARVHHYRLDRVRPKKRNNHSLNDCLIDSEERFVEFLSAGFQALRSSSQYELVKSALESMTTFDDETTIGTNYQRVFSALETLVLAYRRLNQLEFILPEQNDRERFSRDIRDFVKKHPLFNGKSLSSRRAMLYDSIVGLERVSLRRATEHLLEEMGIKIDDQWPLFDRKGGLSLTDIRNLITHGDCFSEEQWGYILEAEESLRLITLRVLLATLGWNPQKSRALWTDWKPRHWQASREALSESQ